MSSLTALAGVGPSEALIGAARHLRVPYEPAEVHERFEAHPDKRSLLALVEIARTLALDAEAFEAVFEDLAGIARPAIVHLRDAASGDLSFALLMDVDEAGVVLENPTSRTRTRLSKEPFGAIWSGVVVVLSMSLQEATEAPPRRIGVAGAIAGDAPFGWARIAGSLMLVAAAVAGGIRGGLAGALAAASLAGGTAICAVLFASSRKSRVASAGSRLASVLCRGGTLTDCEGVLASRWSRIGPFELAAWGLAFFGSSLGLLAIAGLSPDEHGVTALVWLGWTALAASPVSLFLIGVQVWPLRRICPLCMSIHVIVLAGAAAAVAWASPLMVDAGTVPRVLFPWAPIHALLFLGALALVVPHIEMQIENRTHRARLAWVGSTPWGALAEFAGRPPTDLGLPDDAPHLGDDGARFRLDVLVHVTCSGCPPLLEKLEALASRRSGAVRVNLFFPPRDLAVPEDRELCVAFATIGALAGGEQLLRVFELVKKNPWARLDAAKGGAATVVGEFIPKSLPIEAALAEAGRAVDAAGVVLARLKRGTPTLLVAGRPWDSAVDDLETLIVRQPDALAEAAS